MEKPTLPAARQLADDIRALYAKGLEETELWGSIAGPGSSGHLAIEQLLHAAKFQATVVPFRHRRWRSSLRAGSICMPACFRMCWSWQKPER